MLELTQENWEKVNKEYEELNRTPLRPVFGDPRYIQLADMSAKLLHDDAMLKKYEEAERNTAKYAEKVFQNKQSIIYLIKILTGQVKP